MGLSPENDTSSLEILYRYVDHRNILYRSLDHINIGQILLFLVPSCQKMMCELLSYLIHNIIMNCVAKIFFFLLCCQKGRFWRRRNDRNAFLNDYRIGFSYRTKLKLNSKVPIVPSSSSMAIGGGCLKTLEMLYLYYIICNDRNSNSNVTVILGNIVMFQW